MLLNDLKPEQEVFLEVNIGTSVYELKTKVTGHDGIGLMVAPYFYKGNVVDVSTFKKRGGFYNLYYIDEKNSRRVFRNIGVELKGHYGQLYYCVTVRKFASLDTDGERRSDNRISLEKECEVTFNNGETDETKTFSMQNISDGGLAFTTPLEYDIKHTSVTVAFKDSAMGQEFALKLRCTIVREVDMADKRLYGCRIDGADKAFLAYIYMRRRDKTQQ